MSQRQLTIDFKPRPIVVKPEPVRLLLKFEQDFDDFHNKNPKIYASFKSFAFAAINKGYERFSARTIIERIRWQVNVETTDKEYKINDHFVPYYSRLFMKDYPKYEGFFEIRKMS